MKNLPGLAPVFLLMALLAATTAVAGPRDHQDGFFLRLSTGAGPASTSVDNGVEELKISGLGGDLNIAIGGMVAPNLALHGTLFGWSLQDPDLEINGTTIGEINGDVTAAGLGAGLTYYFMPSNLYLSGTLGFGRLEVDGGGLNGDTDRGPLVDLTVGKEWWVGDSWGLGVAGGLTYHSFSDPGLDESWSGTSFCIRFTASRN